MYCATWGSDDLKVIGENLALLFVEGKQSPVRMHCFFYHIQSL